ncbi:MAG: regulatory protein GemA [Candidatus Omnitrophica bacterium]|nr:regulatory protein GemA [Candidatus Omnitrophota bacterium]
MERKKLALVHIIKKELNLSESEYRNILQQAAGVTSARELDNEKFRNLMRYFVRSKYYQVNPYGLTVRQKLYLDYLGKKLGWDKTHLDNFIRKYYHRESLDKLTKKEAIRAIESLKAIKKTEKLR